MGVLILLLIVGLGGGCGRVGSPIPPESTGIAAKLERERLEQERPTEGDGRAEAKAPSEEGKDGRYQKTSPREIILPPLRPIGTP